ncbi:MAG: molybdopterin-dependent oxidoreductase, partial [Spirochaetaceae bacterium]|nr:molybdopterin-dependent oxidoreductase [Spirochaetaceae bacterium]
MKAIPEASLNVRGKTAYIDDLPEPRNMLHGAVKLSASARGRITRIDGSAALALHPSVRVLTHADVPGENQLGFTVADEPLLPEEEWEYWGQPLVLCLAATRNLARRAAELVVVEGEELEATLDPREAARKGAFILPPRTQASGDTAAAFARAALVVSGSVESGGQEHVYLETQGAVAEPRDGDRIHIISGTQGPTVVQRAAARTLGLPMSSVEVEARRLGGGFGGKEDQAASWACLAALGARVTGRPVKLYLDRKTDMRATGKRHPYSSDFRIAMDAEGRILAFEADYYQNSGCSCDLSPAIISRTLFHAVGAYRVPNVRVTGYLCRTNLPSFTAFRGFGAPQGFFVMEAAMDALAAKAGIDPVELRRRNLLAEGDTTHYGMPMARVRAGESFDRLLEALDWPKLRAEIKAHNASHPLEKLGAAIVPNCFGVSFTKLPMNQGGALVHVYQDGSVLVSTGAVEMGQQVSRKIARIAARTLGVPLARVAVERTSTLTVANTVPTAASTGADINGMAALVACEEIRGRLVAKAAELVGATASELSIQEGRVVRGCEDAGLAWENLVQKCHEARIDLSAHGFYATPGLFYDMKAERGSPFAYHVYGAAAVVVRLDVLRGSYDFERAVIVHDVGRSLDAAVDRGQIEGAFAQGLGWAALEELKFGDDGRLLSDTLSTYKLPDARFLPRDLEVEFLPEADNPRAVLNSKAIGEPPLIYGIAGYFALLDALRAARPEGPPMYDLPMTPEKVLDYLMKDRPEWTAAA